MTRSARILMVTPRYAPALGGVERHVAALARGLRSRGVQLEIATTDPTATLPHVAVDDGVTVHRFGTLLHDDVFFLSPGLGAWLARHAREADLFHAHSYHTPLALMAAAVARLGGRPLVLTPHYHGTGHTRARSLLHRPYRFAGAWMVRGADAVIACSHAEADLLRAHFGSGLPITVIPHGVDASPPANATSVPAPAADVPRDRQPLVLAGGRLETYKQVDRVVETMAHLPDHELIVFGSGPAEDALRAAAGAAGVEQRVRILGRITDDELRHWYRGADVFVTLSREEAFGLTVLEAVSAGAAVVASDIPAHREQAHELPADWLRLVSVDAAPGEIAAAILASGRRRDRLAPPRLRGWGEVVSATLDVYRAVLAQRGRMVPATARDDEPA